MFNTFIVSFKEDYNFLLVNNPDEQHFSGWGFANYLQIFKEGSGERDLSTGVRRAKECGRNALIIEQRGGGYSDGHVITFGVKERIDVLLVEKDGKYEEYLDYDKADVYFKDMTDEEKIQAITFYVIDNYSYKMSKVFESNAEPLESMLDNKGGVCASYAYLTNVLLRKPITKH